MRCQANVMTDPQVILESLRSLIQPEINNRYGQPYQWSAQDFFKMGIVLIPISARPDPIICLHLSVKPRRVLLFASVIVATVRNCS